MPRQRDIAARAGDAAGGDVVGAAEADPEPPNWLRLDVVADAPAWAAIAEAEALVEAAAAAAAGHIDFAQAPAALACIALSDDATVQRLNRDHRGNDKPTNVLSFPAPHDATVEGDEARAFLGDVILAAETVLAEAREQAIPPAHHLQHLVVHGLLHLLGFDHGTDEEADDMEALEIEILRDLGIDSPYDIER